MIYILILIIIVAVILISSSHESEEKFKSKIKQLLISQQFNRADIETKKYLIYLLKGNSKHSISENDISAISCKKLREINQLWVEKSHGKFGYSVQKSIFEKYGIDEYQNIKQDAEFLNSSPRDARVTSLSYDGFAYRVGWLDFTTMKWAMGSAIKVVKVRQWIDYFQYFPNEKGTQIILDLRSIWLKSGCAVNKYELGVNPRSQVELIDELQKAPIGHYPSWGLSSNELESTWCVSTGKIWANKIRQCF